MRIVPTVGNTKLCPDARFEQAKYNERPLSRDPSYYKGTSGRVGTRFRTEIFRSARRVLSIKHTPTTRGTGGQHAVSFPVEADRCWPRSNRQRRLQLLGTRAHTRPRQQQHRYTRTHTYTHSTHTQTHTKSIMRPTSDRPRRTGEESHVHRGVRIRPPRVGAPNSGRLLPPSWLGPPAHTVTESVGRPSEACRRRSPRRDHEHEQQRPPSGGTVRINPNPGRSSYAQNTCGRAIWRL